MSLRDRSSECLEHDDPAQCRGPIRPYAALSGSGLTYLRCEAGYEQYVERVQPRMDEIRGRYPDSSSPPGWFDPTYAGERWEDE